MQQYNVQELARVVDYCRNETECRRTLLLQYFSEVFQKENCGVPMGIVCDHCARPCEAETVDATEVAIGMARIGECFARS